MIRHLAQRSAEFDLTQLVALTRTRFPNADVNRVDDPTLGPCVAVYLDTEPPVATLTAWQTDVAGYTVTHPTADEQAVTAAANAATVDANLTALITSLQADVTQDNSVISGANPIIASTGTLSSATLSSNVRSLAQAVKTLANNDINNKKALSNLLHKIQAAYSDLTGT